MRIGLFGGTFSPPHVGHIRAAELFVSSVGLDRLIIMPAGVPPHKEADAGASADDRLQMARLAFSGIGEVSDFEIKKAGKSYSVETLEWLRETYPDDSLYMLVGEDMFLSLDKWREPEKIVRLATVVYMRRCASDGDILKNKEAEYRNKWGADFIYMGDDPAVVSSTEIRRTLNTGGFSEFVTPAVGEYIKKNRLYR